MIFVNTGFLVALFEAQDQLHRRAHQWSAAARGPFLVTEFVLLETYNWFSLARDRSKVAAIRELVTSDPDYQIVPLSSALLMSGIELHESRPDKDWSVTDCISFHVMKERGITRALAYDHHFQQAGLYALLRRDP